MKSNCPKKPTEKIISGLKINIKYILLIETLNIF